MAIDSRNQKQAYPNGVGASTSYGPAFGDGANTPAFRPMSHIRRQIAMQLTDTINGGVLEADFQNAMLHAFPSGCFVDCIWVFVKEGEAGSAALSFTDVDTNTTTLPPMTAPSGEWAVFRDLDRSLRSRSQVVGTVTGSITVVIGFLQTVEDGGENGILAQSDEYPVFGA